ncbi:DUF58 domain-containing protein [Entomospira nematocerorum]|uniref:DUF58 domain-containing protein n=1 Tax=Entomospira nematocerorum TaxID=2719987 RepID=A0A968GBH8_9SPIO|nr:DUF58 domain-containing protein [Entomospira nematocera]NIZ46805.1 DUF58 domain-containing protein [Entomospira nematocera]WDI33398.1 DUF58 domain-containing protein [Entomospira nematocera]
MTDISARIKKLKIKSEKLVDSFFVGDYSSVFKGMGLEFHEARPYIPGDDTRFIDWNVTSRMGQPFCKIFKEERELILTVILDVSASMYGEFSHAKSFTAQEVFALLSFAASDNGDRVGVIAFSDIIELQLMANRGKHHVQSEIQQVLSLKPQRKGSDMSMALRIAGEVMKRRGICVIISDFKTEDYWRELSMLSRKHDVVAIRIESDSDILLPSSGYVTVVDPEEYQTISVMPSSSYFRKEYEGFWQVTRTNWQKNCRRRGVETLTINTKDDTVRALLQFFRRRGHGS